MSKSLSDHLRCSAPAPSFCASGMHAGSHAAASSARAERAQGLAGRPRRARAGGCALTPLFCFWAAETDTFAIWFVTSAVTSLRPSRFAASPPISSCTARRNNNSGAL